MPTYRDSLRRRFVFPDKRPDQMNYIDRMRADGWRCFAFATVHVFARTRAEAEAAHAAML